MARPDSIPSKAKLTKTIVDSLPLPDKGQYPVWDTVQPGFGVRVSQGGAKTFILQARVNGTERKVTLGRLGAVTVDQARKQAKAESGDMARGVDPVKKRQAARRQAITLENARDEYLAERDLKDSTKADLSKSFKHLSDWLKLPLSEITPAMVQAKHRKITSKAHSSGARANATMRYLRAVLNYASAKYATNDGIPLLPYNPVKTLGALKQWNRVERRRTFVKPAEMPALYEAITTSLVGTRFENESRDCLLVMLMTGTRPSEALNLEWRGVNFDEGTLTFFDTKNRSDHELPLTEFVRALLIQRQAIAGPTYVFSRADELRPKHVRPAINKLAEHMERELKATDFRRTFITAAERLEISPYTLKRMLNHKLGVDVTEGYIIPTTDRLRDPMQRVEDALLRHAKVKSADVVELRA